MRAETAAETNRTAGEPAAGEAVPANRPKTVCGRLEEPKKALPSAMCALRAIRTGRRRLIAAARRQFPRIRTPV